MQIVEQYVGKKKKKRKTVTEARPGAALIRRLQATDTSRSTPTPAAALQQPSVSRSDLADLERYLDAVWAKLGIDIKFGAHFFDRINDRRESKKPIQVAELRHLFTAAFEKFGNQFKGLAVGGKKQLEAILTDLSNKLNVPFILRVVGRGVELFTKTIMRKDNFKSPDKVFKVEGVLTNDSMIEMVRQGADLAYLLDHSQRR
tara:strand:- start:496 stop:1101 length:606 start_codon:yes stop_codon:yes gene_type:complete